MLTALAALSALLAAGDDGGGPHEHRPHDDNPKKELQNWSSLIGIITAIVGNVLIALALNVQRYAHLRLHRERAARRERARAARRAAAAAAAAAKKPVGPPGQNANGEYQFVESGERRDRRDAAGEEDMNGHGPNRHDRTSALGYSFDDDDDNQTTNGDEVDDPLARSYQTVDSRCTECSDFDEDNGTDDQGKGMPAYLRSPYWWLGQILITVGEMGNFLAYGFAPASIVSPLGVVALISNCVIAPILFHEPFRARDFWGVLVAIAGAVTVVLSANTKETKLGAHEIWDAITTLDFVIYMLVTWMLIFLLMWASPRYGHRTILIDLGLVGLFGGYTALATKGVSSMLSSTLFVTFTQPVAYVLIFVVVATAVMQVRYVNRALQRFNSTQVIPIQFVMFTLSVIIGSAVLYRDFKRTTAEQVVKFVGGCLLTFFGVFLITSGRPPSEDSEIEDLEEAQRRAAAEEEIIGLQEHGPVISHKPSHQQYQAHGTRRDSSAESATGTSSSRRSSRASRVNFVDAFARPLGIIASGVGHGGVPSSRIPPAPGPKIASVPSSLIENPWATDVEDEASHVGSTLQSPPTSSVAQSEAASSVPATPLSQASGVFASGQQRETYTHRPTTSSAARQHTHQHHRDASSSPSAGHRLFTAGGGAPIISPSPLSSTVTAVVHDTLRRGDAAAADRDRTNRRASVRRARPGLRESLFVPYSDDDDLLLAGESAVAGADRSVAPSADSVTRVASLPGESGAQQSPGSASHAPPPRASFRARAASVGSTLGDFFRSRRRRRGTLLERGGGAAATADADEANESTALLGSSVRGGGSRRVRGRG